MKGDGGREWKRDEDGRGEGLLRTEGERKNRGNGWERRRLQSER